MHWRWVTVGYAGTALLVAPVVLLLLVLVALGRREVLLHFLARSEDRRVQVGVLV